MKRRSSIFLLSIFSFILLTGLTHTVKKNDTLWDIAGHYYGDPFLWPLVYEANKNIIQDPHWIYPDQIFTIPPYQGEETRAVIPETTEAGSAKVETTKTVAKPIISTTPQEKVAPTTEEIPEEQKEIKVVSVLKAPTGAKKKTVRKITLIAPQIFSLAKSLAYSAGYITKEQGFNTGKIVQGAGEIERTQFTMNDKVAINKGTEDGIKEGDIYTVYRMGKGVYNPITDEYLGRIVKILGDIKILKTKKHTGVARILRSFDTIKPGDLFMERKIPTLPSGNPKPFISNVTGTLVYFKGNSNVIKPFNIVYVQPDSENSLQPGDVLLLYKEKTLGLDSGTDKLPIIPVGKVQIINLKGDNTATGYILSIMGHTDIKLGTKFRLVGRIGE